MMKTTIKRIMGMVLVAIMAIGLAPITAHANIPEVTIIVDGRTLVQNNDIGFAQIIDDRTFVPLRLVAENMGVEVLWQHDGPQVITMRGANNLQVFHTIGELNAYDHPVPTLGNILASTDVPSFISSGRTMVGLRLIADSLNADVIWEGATRTVRITTNRDLDAATPPTIDLTQPDAVDAFIEEQRATMGTIDFEDPDRFTIGLIEQPNRFATNFFVSYEEDLRRAVHFGNLGSQGRVVRFMIRDGNPLTFETWMYYTLSGVHYTNWDRIREERALEHS